MGETPNTPAPAVPPAGTQQERAQWEKDHTQGVVQGALDQAKLRRDTQQTAAVPPLESTDEPVRAALESTDEPVRAGTLPKSGETTQQYLARVAGRAGWEDKTGGDLKRATGTVQKVVKAIENK